MSRDERAARKASTSALAAKVRWRKNVGLLPNVAGNLLIKDMKKPEGVNTFVLVFTGEICCQVCQVPCPRGSLGEWIIIVNSLKDHLRQFDIYKSMGPDRMHPWVPRELSGVCMRPLPIIKMLWYCRRSPLLGKKRTWHTFSRKARKRFQESRNCSAPCFPFLLKES